MSFLKMQVIPYYPELGKELGSITSAILMRQLEYWFDKTGNKGFYKFLEPCDNPCYKNGDSWVEELGMTKSEFRTAFSKIGIVYKSKNEFDESEDKFQNKFYCSYYNRLERKTYYFRNNNLVRKFLINISSKEDGFDLIKNIEFPRNQESEFLEINNVNLQKSTFLTSRNQESEFPYTEDYTEDYTEKTCTYDMSFEKEEKEDFGINPKGYPRKDKLEKFLNENLQGIDYVPNIELAIKSFENNLIKKGALNPEKEVKDFLVNNYNNGIQQNLSLNVIANSIITGKRIEQVKVNTIEIENNDNVKTEIIAPVTRIEKIKFMKNILSENELSKYREKVSKELLENYNISEKSVIESELDNYLILLYNKKYKNEVA